LGGAVKTCLVALRGGLRRGVSIAGHYAGALASGEGCLRQQGPHRAAGAFASHRGLRICSSRCCMFAFIGGGGRQGRASALHRSFAGCAVAVREMFAFIGGGRGVALQGGCAAPVRIVYISGGAKTGAQVHLWVAVHIGGGVTGSGTFALASFSQARWRSQ
jgi:hypothetical protein